MRCRKLVLIMWYVIVKFIFNRKRKRFRIYKFLFFERLVYKYWYIFYLFDKIKIYIIIYCDMNNWIINYEM